MKHLGVTDELERGAAAGSVALDNVRWSPRRRQPTWLTRQKDVPLEQIIGEVLKVNAGAIYVEGADPRHAHEWRVFENVTDISHTLSARPAGTAHNPGKDDAHVTANRPRIFRTSARSPSPGGNGCP